MSDLIPSLQIVGNNHLHVWRVIGGLETQLACRLVLILEQLLKFVDCKFVARERDA